MRRQVLETIARNRQVFYRTLIKNIEQEPFKKEHKIDNFPQRQSRNSYFNTERLVIASSTIGAQRRVNEKFKEVSQEYSSRSGFLSSKIDFRDTLRECASINNATFR